LEHGAAELWVLLVVTRQTPVAAPAAENLLDNPAFLQDVEARRCLRVTPHDVKFDLALVLNLSLKVSPGKTAVGKDDLNLLPPRLLLDVE
jgi:hypothetical protein